MVGEIKHASNMHEVYFSVGPTNGLLLLSVFTLYYACADILSRSNRKIIVHSKYVIETKNRVRHEPTLLHECVGRLYTYIVRVVAITQVPGQIRVGRDIANTSVLDNATRQPDRKPYSSESSANGFLDDYSYIVEKKVRRARDSERTAVYVGGVVGSTPVKYFYGLMNVFSPPQQGIVACVYRFRLRSL